MNYYFLSYPILDDDEWADSEMNEQSNGLYHKLHKFIGLGAIHVLRYKIRIK